MKIIPITESLALDTIDLTDKVFVYPTDTCYGIGCNALDEQLVHRIYAIKGRDEQKPLSIMVSDKDMFRVFGVMNEVVEKLIEKYLPGALTIVVPKTSHLPDFLCPGQATIGIRIPEHPFCRQLIQTLQAPVITTSANVAGQKNPYSAEEIMWSFANTAEQPDIIFDGGSLDPANPPSTVVMVEGDQIKVLRQGKIQVQL